MLFVLGDSPATEFHVPDCLEHPVFSISVGSVVIPVHTSEFYVPDFWEHPVFSISVGGVILFLLTLLNVMCRLLGTLCLFHFYRWCNSFLFTLLNCTCPTFGNTPVFYISVVLSCSHRPWRWNRQDVSKRRQIKLKTPGIHPKKLIQYSEHGESSKWIIKYYFLVKCKILGVLLWRKNTS